MTRHLCWLLCCLVAAGASAQDTGPTAATPPAAQEKPAEKPAADAAKAKDTATAKDTEEKPATPEASKPAKAKDASGTPQRFIPSEQVRSDFDVSFPVDI